MSIRVNPSDVLISKVSESHSDLSTPAGQIKYFIINFEIRIVVGSEVFFDESLNIVFMWILILISTLEVVLLDSLFLVDFSKTSLHQLLQYYISDLQ